MKWTAELIAATLARQVFQRELICPNCTWTGHEADLLIVHPSLRLIDVEIKTTRADARADIDKAKWWHQPERASWQQPWPEPVRVDWPPRVWKHYYAMPAEIWKPDLLADIPAVSGVLTLMESTNWHGEPTIRVNTVRRARPNRAADTISAADAVRISRLASIRYWQVLAGQTNRWSQ